MSKPTTPPVDSSPGAVTADVAALFDRLHPSAFVALVRLEQAARLLDRFSAVVASIGASEPTSNVLTAERRALAATEAIVTSLSHAIEDLEHEHRRGAR